MIGFTVVVHSLTRWICWLSVLALAAIMVLTCSDVVLRYFGYPIRGTFDVVGLLGAAVIALPIAYTQILRGHIAIGFIVSKFSKRAQTIIEIINGFLNIGLYSLLAWQCYLYGSKLWRLGRVSETVLIPIFPFAYIVAFGCALMCLVLLIELYDLMARLVRQ